LVGMQYADDLDHLPVRSVDHQMRSAGMDTYRGCELAPLTGHLWKVSEQVEECKQAIHITIRLLYAPVAHRAIAFGSRSSQAIENAS